MGTPSTSTTTRTRLSHAPSSHYPVRLLTPACFNQLATSTSHSWHPYQPPWPIHLIPLRQLRQPTGTTILPPVPDDDDMGQGDEHGFVYNAPALPDPPSFNSSTKSEWRTFIRQYN
ncbi:hypothetical protein H257_17233 [Aphanomyces astaci]|uniref:Uncharacterized protein n=1 Tax=Aphanomyces astaci TaxID=112090 RepID=W4FHC7_APHAT|nr:hypothetical protein H257_17233 [Aphanomyces astaci]ETV66264.1 hypothetical protein H257_17233 [Aphanomyces astaci]|eukprot:XP_009844251.1 hypothetical protein H257_17233 [Aphanomyces astaci]